MAESQGKQPDLVFCALGDPTRREMLGFLAGGERTVSQLKAPRSISFEGASKHLRSLEHAGPIERRVVGRTHMLRLRPAPLSGAGEWLSFYERFWTAHLDALNAMLKGQDDHGLHVQQSVAWLLSGGISVAYTSGIAEETIWLGDII